jgi:hypothetical protein
MAPLSIVDKAFWALSTALELWLLVLLFQRKLYRSHPTFTVYVAIIILQSPVTLLLYLQLGALSRPAYFLAWGLQTLVVCTRWLAVVEIARNAMIDYRGIWTLVKRILLTVSVIVLLYSILASRTKGLLIILTADRAIELCIATFVVGMFFFVRYYRLPISPLGRTLAIGFCLYSCVKVINDTMFEHWRRSIGSFYHYLELLAFSATLLLWIGAAWMYSEAREKNLEPARLTPEKYDSLSQEINSRLHGLNSRLDQFFRSKDLRP